MLPPTTGKKNTPLPASQKELEDEARLKAVRSQLAELLRQRASGKTRTRAPKKSSFGSSPRKPAVRKRKAK
ncbi:MAG: hypothetical protein AABY11_03120 [archaeon]